MPIAKHNVILAVLLAALVAGNLILTGTQGAPREIGRLLPQFVAAGAARILIEKPGASSTERIELQRTEGGDWVLPGHFAHPAGQARVQTLLDRLASLTNLDLLSDNESSHVDYGVDERGTTVRVFDGGGNVLGALVQGRGPGTGGSSAVTYVRPAGARKVYRAPGFGPLSTDPMAWLDTRFMNFEPALVQRLLIAGTEFEGPLELVRRDVDHWLTLGDEEVSPRAVREFLARVDALFFDTIVGPSGGESWVDPAFLLELELSSTRSEDEPPLTAYFGPAVETANGAREAERTGAPWIVRLEPATFALIRDAAEALLRETR